MAPDLPPASASFPHPAGQRKASSPPDPLGTSSSHSPTHYNLSSLLKSPAGITEEGEGFGWGHLMDGRYTVPQVHSKLPGLVMEGTSLIIVLKPLLLTSCLAYHGRAVVIVFVIWLPGLEAAPAESMVAFGTGHAMEEASWSKSCLWPGPHQECPKPGRATKDAPSPSISFVS